jgi:hypothetical protein
MEESNINPQRLYQIAAAKRPPNVLHVPCSDLSGSSNYETGELTAPIPDSLEKLLIYLHECGHFWLHKDAQIVPTYLREFQAETWALKAMTEAGLNLTDEFVFKSRQRIANFIRGACKNKVGTLNEEAVEFAWSAFHDFERPKIAASASPGE